MMMNRLKAALGAVTVGLLAGTSLAHAQDADADLIKQGEYVARLGDCVACHTALNGQKFAGGLSIKTPVGTIYSTNITPDPTYGIGTYTLQEFDEAVRHGIRKDGSTLYPAMPYPAFSRMTPEDIKALYAYFMHGVEPVAQKNLAEDIHLAAVHALAAEHLAHHVRSGAQGLYPGPPARTRKSPVANIW
jgi:mono/diheme cytochrome c family protein